MSREYVYRDRRTGEIYVSLEPVKDPGLELIDIVEVRPYGGRRAAGHARAGGSEKKEEGHAP